MENIVCYVIDVDCLPNHPKDARFVGPKYIGFEFYVRKREKDIMKSYINCMLHEYNIPVICIKDFRTKIINEKQLHSKEQIKDIISSEGPKMLNDYYKNEMSKKLVL